MPAVVSDSCRSPRQVAAYLRVSLAKVLKWIKAGTLRAMNVGEGGRPQYRIRPEALDDFENGRSAAAPKTSRRKPAKRPDGWIDFF